MNQWAVLLLRAIVGAAFAVVISRLFYPQAPMAVVAIFGFCLVGAAYLLEFWRKKRSDTPPYKDGCE